MLILKKCIEFFRNVGIYVRISKLRDTDIAVTLANNPLDFYHCFAAESIYRCIYKVSTNMPSRFLC